MALTGGRSRRFWTAVQQYVDDAYEAWRPSIRAWNDAYPAILDEAKRSAAHALTRGVVC